ncbi:glutamine synthetase family protein [Lentisalinibacter sediminis]|uniref:glutamine synthetase family protein n=1 Tax=Lentisalinibacter sediminis TaxID=2992237 RepID=UPI00386756C2
MAAPDGRLEEYLAAHPDCGMMELLIADMVGVLRGKRVLPEEFAKVFSKGFNIPGSVVMLDSMGAVIAGLPYGADDGDPDVYARPIPETLAPIPWARRDCAQVLFSLYERDGAPYFADPRHVLERAALPLREMGLTIVMAVELEFYLLDAAHTGVAPRMPAIIGTGHGQRGEQVYHPQDLWDIEEFLDELMAMCQAQSLPVGTTISEFAPGQFEVNLHHVADPLAACDHAVLLKRVIRAVARRHGTAACFMAKPFGEYTGNGLHLHVSLVRADGSNFFSGGDPALAEAPFDAALRHAIGGLQETMADAMAIFAPNANSYRRLRPDFFAPVTPNWGVNHRGVSLRIPLSGPNNLRIEHRTAGADANPYLVAAAVLAGIHHGISRGIEPGPMVAEGASIEPEVTLPIRWEAALEHFGASGFLHEYLGDEYCRVYEHARRVENQRIHNEITDRDYQWYLRNV